MNRATHRSPAWRRLGDIALTIGAVLGSVCVLLAVLAVVLDVRVLSFRSGSMSPTIPTGALALSRSTAAADLRVGDVVTVLTSGGSRVTHRIVEIQRHGDQASLELRGDANRVADAAPYDVSEADRVFFSVPVLGYVASAITSPIGLLVLGGYATLLLRVVLRRRPDPAPAVIAVLTFVAVGTLAQRSLPTLAAWTDSAATSGSTFTATSVPAPGNFRCGGLGLLSVSFAWNAVPGATSYTLHYGSGATYSTTGTTASLSGALGGGTAWVTAEISYGSTVWSSAGSSTLSYTVAVVSLCA